MACLVFHFLFWWWQNQNMYLPKLSTPAGNDTRSIFKEFTRTGFRIFLLLDQLLYQVKGSRLPDYLPIAGVKIVEFIPFPRVLALFEMQSHSGFEFWSPCPFLTTITITRSHPQNQNLMIISGDIWMMTDDKIRI